MKSPSTSKAPELGPKEDLVFDELGEPAYMALVEVASYESYMPDWEYESLTRKIVSQMNAGRIVAWGCPEVDLSIRITNRPLAKRDLAKVDASMSVLLTTKGLLCLSSYTSLTMCADFADEKLPQKLDRPFRVPPGTYRVDVHRLFPHQDGEQYPEDDTDQGNGYCVVLSPPAKTWKPTRYPWVPWAAPPE